MSRNLRSGRAYDPLVVPVAPKRRSRKRAETSSEDEEISKLAVVKTSKLTFGSMEPTERVQDYSPLVVNDGKRRGVACGGLGVKISPRLFISTYGRAPPIRPSRRLLPATESDARPDSDAPSDRDAADAGDEAANRALELETGFNSEAAESAPVAHDAPSTITPDVQRVSQGNDSSDDEDNIYITARTSRVRGDFSLDVPLESTPVPHYVVIDEIHRPSPSKRRRDRKKRAKARAQSEVSPSPRREPSRPISWADELDRCDHGRAHSPELPEIDPTWVNPDWSRSAYLNAPTPSEPEDRVSETDSVEVNAFVYELDENYVYSDGEYAEVLRNIREESHGRQTPSQTSGAGPSGVRHRSRVVIEEVEDEDAPQVHVPSSSDEESSVVVGKGKEKHNKKKKSGRIPELGIEVNNLTSKNKAKRARRRSSGRFDCSRIEQTPQGFRSGGYLELMHGDAMRRRPDSPHIANSGSSRTDQTFGNVTRERDHVPADRPSVRRSVGGGGNLPPPRRPPSDPSDDSCSSSDSEDGTYRGHHSDDESSSDNDSSNSSSSSSDDEDNRRLKRKLRRMKEQQRRLEKKLTAQARSGYKAQAPKTYDGEANLDKFELFVFNYDNWCLDTRLKRRERVRNVSRFLDGKASTWYMSNVATNLNTYNIDMIYQGIFDYCFPPDFKEQLRRKYKKKQQGDQTVQDYFAEMELLRRRLKINLDQHVYRAYDGAAKYIKGEWAIKGILPEDTTIDELRTTALDIERAHRIRKSIDHNDEPDRKRRDRSRSPNRRYDKKSNRSWKNNTQSGQTNEGRRDDRKNSRIEGRRDDNSGSRNSHGRERAENWKKNTNKNTLTSKQRDEYRAANKCFECGETGHMVKDCPRRNKARPSRLSTNATTLKPEQKVRASSVLLKELDRLTEVKESIEVSSLRVDAATAASNRSSKKSESRLVVERNATRVKDLSRRVPNTLVVQAEIEGESVRALLDSGSQADLVSTTLVDQLKLNKCVLTKPLQLQMAMSGSRGTLMYNVRARMRYQTVDEEREFDIGNLESYDVILGTPFLFQHSVRISFNPNGVFISSPKALPLEGQNIILINSLSADVLEARMNELREMLRSEAEELCKDAADTPLPPLRAINHTIPLMNENCVYKFRPSRCPEALKGQFEAKARDYIKTGRWKLATGTNAIPMLFLVKKSKDGSTKLRTVLDKREQNDNTRKLASPLPNIEEIISMASRYKYRTLLDGKDAYEQIRLEPKDIYKTLFHTPLGTMISLVMQQGDCNAGATYQALMNYLFAEFIGIFMFVYLDDIIIFSSTIEEHVKHIRLVFAVLKREKFYLSPSKMQFFAVELAILGHIIDNKGIKMDPAKVDSISKWKTPTNKDQLASYLGALGYLAPNCAGIRVPMAVLTKRAGSTALFIWEGTEERAFRETQRIVEEYRDRHRVALKYDKDAPMIYLITDASLTGASGFVSQGNDWQTAPVASFWSGKFNSAQQNYTVTDRELLAIVASLDKFQPLLHGIKFKILTDHEALKHLKTQKTVSPRQARWLEKLSQFEFEIKYIEGTKNIFADALSRIYSDEPKGIVRAQSEYVQEELSEDEVGKRGEELSQPLLTGLAATVSTESGL